MSLYSLAPPTPAQGPRLHALVIGVGDYRHLGLGVPQPATLLSGLEPLTTTPLSAKRIARWLETEYQNAACPLGSIELLLSPAESLQRADGSTVAVEQATMTNIEVAFRDWYARCNTDQKNIAFFYFAGHGLSTLSQFLLPADFANPAIPDAWKNCIDFTGMQTGMAKCAAQTQFFFVDACRDAPIAALLQHSPHGNPLINSSFQDRVDLSAAYFAASEGRQAFGRNGQETFFCQALIMCLQGVAARKTGPTWQVDAASLAQALVSVSETLAAVENLPLTIECRMQKPVPLHFPQQAAVLLKVDCASPAARAESAISVTQQALHLLSPVGDPRPWMNRLTPGDATIEVTFTSYPKGIVQDLMTPPTYEVLIPQ